MNSLSLKILNNGFVSKYQQLSSQDSQFKYDLLGNVFESDGTLVCEGLRPSVGGDHVQHLSNEILSQGDLQNTHFLEGRALYAGHLMLHYGHFITEGLSRLYPVVKSIDFDYIAFLPFIFGGNLLVNSPPDYHEFIFASLGISLDQIILLRDLTCFNELWVPSPAWPINSDAHPVMSDIYRKVRDYSLNSFTCDELKSSHNLYIARSANLRSDRNYVIEEAFRDLGFKVVALEKFSFREQMTLLNQAKCVAGFSGSGLHNIVFCNPKTSVVEITDSRTRGKPLPMQIAANCIDRRRSLVLDHSMNVSLIKKSVTQFLG